MIIRIKKRALTLISVFLILTIAIIFATSIPFIYAATTNVTTGGFGVWIIISNQAPGNVTLVNVTGFGIDPVAGGNSVILIIFNASDPDGIEDINGTRGGKVIVNLTLGTPGEGNQFRVSSSCVNTSYDTAEIVSFNCTINMRHYDNTSANWVINISVTDSNSATTINDSSGASPNTFIYNSLSSFSLTANHPGETANLNFTSLNVGDNDKPAKAPIVLNNTGNDDFDQINITGADLISGSNSIDISNFAVNATNNTAGNGQAMTLLPFTLRALAQSGTSENNQSLLHGPGVSGDTVPYTGATDTVGNISLYFWIDVPSSLTTGTYNNTWNITVIDLP